MEVSTSTSLSDIYPEESLSFQRQRWQNLISQFKEHYGRLPDFIARSPGRVNIIGEHIDYSLYSVIPMAVETDVLLAISLPTEPSSRTVNLRNTNADKFPTRSFDIPSSGEISIDASTHEWTNYFKAGMRGACELLAKKEGKDSYTSKGMDVLMDGNVPSGGGLSSSAAFVCATALGVMRANGVEGVDKKELVETAIVSERAVGVNSGGMDQSASVFSLQGSALYVSFVPDLHVKPLSFPQTKPEFSFVIANSLVAADKHVTAPVNYNLRVVECSLAAVFLAKVLNVKKSLPQDSSPLGVSLRGLQDTYYEEKESMKDNTQTPVPELQKQLEQLVALVEDYLPHEDGYTREQISDLLGISVDEINERFTSKFPVRAERFLLRQRALHVFNEAIRVSKFMELLSNASSSEGETLLRELGTLLNETQESCRDVYECSCPELDQMCEIARAAGAYGSRLTGAGWGGCSVHLVPTERVERVKEAWEVKYYRKKWPDISEEKLREAVVVSKPGSGSSVFVVKEGMEL